MLGSWRMILRRWPGVEAGQHCGAAVQGLALLASLPLTATMRRRSVGNSDDHYTEADAKAEAQEQRAPGRFASAAEPRALGRWSRSSGRNDPGEFAVRCAEGEKRSDEQVQRD